MYPLYDGLSVPVHRYLRRGAHERFVCDREHLRWACREVDRFMRQAEPTAAARATSAARSDTDLLRRADTATSRRGTRSSSATSA